MSSNNWRNKLAAWLWSFKENNRHISKLTDEVYVPKTEHAAMSLKKAEEIANKIYEQSNSEAYRTVAHNSDCNIFDCGPQGCWKYVPDVIVSKTTISTQEYNQTRRKNKSSTKID